MQDGLAEVSGLPTVMDFKLIQGSGAVPAESVHSRITSVSVPEDPMQPARTPGNAPAASHSASSQLPASSREGFQLPAEQAASSLSAPLSISPHQAAPTGGQRHAVRSARPVCEANDACSRLAGGDVDGIKKGSRMLAAVDGPALSDGAAGHAAALGKPCSLQP